MLSDNIRKYRKSKQMSQDELAEKLDVTRQSISLWETGQTQPSLDNIVALAKLFDISTDALLTDNEPTAATTDAASTQSAKTSKSARPVIISVVCLLIVAALITTAVLLKNNFSKQDVPDAPKSADESVNEIEESSKTDETYDKDKAQPIIKYTDSTKDQALSDASAKVQENISDTEDITPPTVQETVPPAVQETVPPVVQETVPPVVQETVPPVVQETVPPVVQETVPPVVQETDNNENVDISRDDASSEQESKPEPSKTKSEKDLFEYFKDFVIQNGILNGDYCYYSMPADTYGGYASEDFSLYYWGDTDKVEFCLHSVIDETFSINFYLYIPKRYTGKYEYISSYYFRDTGEPLYEAKGIITAEKFTKNYPLNCNRYTGSAEVQNDFMEMSRQGICDLLDCLENFLIAENLDYSFDDLGFTSF